MDEPGAEEKPQSRGGSLEEFISSRKNPEAITSGFILVSIVIDLVASYLAYTRGITSGSLLGNLVLLFIVLGAFAGYYCYGILGSIGGGILGFFAPALILLIVIVLLGTIIGMTLDKWKNLRFYEKELKNSPHSPELWNIKGCVFATAIDYPRALECFEESLSLDPSYEPARINRDIALKRMKS